MIVGQPIVIPLLSPDPNWFFLSIIEARTLHTHFLEGAAIVVVHALASPHCGPELRVCVQEVKEDEAKKEKVASCDSQTRCTVSATQV
jgi:hypothetical protein